MSPIEMFVEQMSFLVAGGKTDIGADLVPRLVSQGGVFAFPFKGSSERCRHIGVILG